MLAGMPPRSAKRRNGLHTPLFCIPPRPHASRCASGNFSSGASKPCRHRSQGHGGRRHFTDESSRLTRSMKLAADISMPFTRRKHVRQQHQDHCGICKEYHNARAFRRTREGRVNVCKSCELVKCKACAMWLSQSSFTRQSVSLHFQSGQTIKCTTCAEQQTAREKELKLRMKQSKRLGCVCKHPLSHTQRSARCT